MLDYPVTLTPDDNGTVLVTFADVLEAISFGVDDDEAVLQAVDPLETALSLYVDDRKSLPVPSRPLDGQRTMRSAGNSRCAWLAAAPGLPR